MTWELWFFWSIPVAAMALELYGEIMESREKRKEKKQKGE